MKRIALILSLLVVAAAATVATAGEGAACDRSKAHAAQHADHHQAAQHKVAERAKHGWLGVDSESVGDGYRITEVYAGSPAAEAGFRPGDVLVAMNGIRFAEENKAQLKAAKKALRPGSRVDYTLQRDGTERQIAATLAPVPEAVMAEWEAKAVHELAAEQVASTND